MHITKYLFIYPISKTRFYMLHTLLGSIDIIESTEYDIIEKWKNCTSIIPETALEKKLYQNLITRKYILTHSDEIKLIKQTKKLATSTKKIFPIVTFILTYDCNFKCPYCFEKERVDNTSIMTTSMVDQIFNIHKNKINNICFYGGEPFLPQNMDIINYIISKSPHATYSAISNGYYLDEYLEILKKIHIEFIQITLDGSKDYHNMSRILHNGNGTYDKIMKNIDLCLNLHIPIKIRMNISEKNIESCLSLREQLSKKYSSYPLMFELQPIFQYNTKTRNLLEKKIYQSDLKENSLLNDNYFTYNTIVNTYLPIQYYFSTMASTFYPITNNCDAETQRVCYDIYGLYYTCLVSVGDKTAACGTYYPEYSFNAKSIADRSIYNIPECSECTLAFICGGGCGYQVMDSVGNSCHPNCHNVHHILTEIIPKSILKKFNV